ncbi:unnamed protein product [Paramecium octaurelia]|uniref:Uncharacterized protein n=1 Tax=Paramecium octaurelia TaxID=43137 RepID=A0A8S1U0P1_PAROT|nr:unnamed protein product [Paramecium octaurelia]
MPNLKPHWSQILYLSIQLPVLLRHRTKVGAGSIQFNAIQNILPYDVHLQFIVINNTKSSALLLAVLCISVKYEADLRAVIHFKQFCYGQPQATSFREKYPMIYILQPLNQSCLQQNGFSLSIILCTKQKIGIKRSCKISSINQIIITTYSNTFPAVDMHFQAILYQCLKYLILPLILNYGIIYQQKNKKIQFGFNYFLQMFYHMGIYYNHTPITLQYQFLGSNFLIVQILMNNLQVANQLMKNEMVQQKVNCLSYIEDSNNYEVLNYKLNQIKKNHRKNNYHVVFLSLKIIDQNTHQQHQICHNMFGMYVESQNMDLKSYLLNTIIFKQRRKYIQILKKSELHVKLLLIYIQLFANAPTRTILDFSNDYSFIDEEIQDKNLQKVLLNVLKNTSMISQLESVLLRCHPIKIASDHTLIWNSKQFALFLQLTILNCTENHKL